MRQLSLITPLKRKKYALNVPLLAVFSFSFDKSYYNPLKIKMSMVYTNYFAVIQKIRGI